MKQEPQDEVSTDDSMMKSNQHPPKKPVNPKWDIPAAARKVVNKYKNNSKDKERCKI